MCQSLTLQASMLLLVFEASKYGDNLAIEISRKCRVSIPLVYKWKDGSKAMSPDYLPTLYAITDDPRVFTMLMPVGSVFIPPVNDPAQKDVLLAAATAVRESAEAHIETLNSMADGILEIGELENMLLPVQEAAAAFAAFAVVIKKRMEAVCTARQ